MLITFSCKAYANVTMFGEVGLHLLKMMGHSGTVPGALRAEDVPAALSQLKTAIDKEIKAQAQHQTEDDPDTYVEPPVSLSTRALPLIELLSAAAKEQCNVMWEG